MAHALRLASYTVLVRYQDTTTEVSAIAALVVQYAPLFTDQPE